MKVFYDRDYVGAKDPFDTTRKAADIAEQCKRLPGVVIEPPQRASLAEIRLAHESRYVNALKTGKGYLASSAGFEWDRGYFRSILASTGGVIDAAITAMNHAYLVAGSLSSGLHHARADTGSGFCAVNGLAVAAKIATGLRPKTQLRSGYPDRPAQRVLILDLDAHCGGGTYSIIEDDRRIYQTDVSVCRFDGYDICDRHRPRHRHRVIDYADAYLPAIEEELEHAKHEIRPDLVLYNAGMDPHEDSGGLTGITTEVLRVRERMVFDWARANGFPIAFVLAGGYTSSWMSPRRLAALHTMTVAAAAGAKMPRVPSRPSRGGKEDDALLPDSYAVVPVDGGPAWLDGIEQPDEAVEVYMEANEYAEHNLVGIYADGHTQTIDLKGSA